MNKKKQALEIIKRLKEEYEGFKIVAIEPDKMPLISQGKILGSHKIEGIGDDFIPDLVDKNVIDDILLINDNDAINMSRILANELGLGVGILGSPQNVINRTDGWILVILYFLYFLLPTLKSSSMSYRTCTFESNI